MNLLVVGDGGLAHAIAWKLAHSLRTKTIFVAPGNGGTALESTIVNIPLTDTQDLVTFAKQEKIGLTIVASEASSSDGTVDAFQAAGLEILGPTKAIDRLNTCRNFARSFLGALGISFVPDELFADRRSALDYIERQQFPLIIAPATESPISEKFVAHTLTQAYAAIDDIFMPLETGTDSSETRILIKQNLARETFNFIALSDGRNAVPLATCQNHDLSTNHADGIGVRAPSPAVTPTLHAQIMREIINPIIHSIGLEIQPFRGFIQLDLIRSISGRIQVAGLNFCPRGAEMQAALLRLKSDLFSLVRHAAGSSLGQAEPEWYRFVALHMPIMTALPDDAHCSIEAQHASFSHNIPAHYLQHTCDYHIFHMGGMLTQLGRIDNPSSSGTVLGIAALGENVRNAYLQICEIAKNIRAMHHRI